MSETHFEPGASKESLNPDPLGSFMDLASEFIYVGEMRDRQAIDTGIHTVQCGHLCLHTPLFITEKLQCLKHPLSPTPLKKA
jgi:Tfp pilus assembly ATPase PilU